MATEARQETHGASGTGSEVDVRNWFGDLDWEASVLVEARSVEDIVAAMRDTDKYPSPVRGRGSGHSTTICGVADGGTVVDVTRMDRILDIGEDTVTVEAGAILIDVAKALEQRNLQFYVNIELGNATMGSLATCATKDASMPGEYGQANSYCVGMKLVTPSGEILEVNESDPELLQAARSSYGLLGVVYEATFKVQPLQDMAVEHGAFKLDEFAKKLPELFKRGQSMMMYIFPYLDRVGVEFRRYAGPADQATKSPNHTLWKLRNFAWKTFMPGFGAATERWVPNRGARYRMVNGLNRVTQTVMLPRLKAANTVPMEQTIRYPEVSGGSRYTFSIWAFPEDQYGRHAARVLQVREGVLPPHGLPAQHAPCRVPDHAGRQLALLLHLPQQRADDRSGLHRSAGLEGLPQGVQPVLQRPRRQAALQPVVGPDARAGAQGVRRQDR